MPTVPAASMDWPTTTLDWAPAYRIIPTRFPAVNLFDRVASADDFDALYELESPVSYTHLRAHETTE